MYLMLLGLFALIFALGIALCLVQFWLDFHKQREQIAATRARRYRRATTFHYDQNGNPEYIYNPETETLIIPPTGNQAFSPTILIRDSIQRNIKADKDQPILYNIPQRAKSLNGDKTIEMLEAEVLEPEISDVPKLPISEGEKADYIRKCIKEGIGLVDAARAININPGGSKAYKAFADLWATIVARKDIGPLS